MENKLIAGIVGLAICIIVLAGVLMPILINTANPVVQTYTNDVGNSVRASLYGTDETVTLSYDSSVAVNDIVVNGTDSVNCSGVFGFLTDNACISMGNSKVWISSDSGVYTRYNTVSAFEATFTEGVMTASVTDTTQNDTFTVTASYSYVYVPNATGDYVMIDGSGGKTVYIKSDSDVAGVTFGNSVMFTVNGNHCNFMDLNEGTVAYNKTLVSGTDDTYTISITQNGGDILASYKDDLNVDRTAYIWKIAIPYTVVAHEKSEYYNLWSVIPIFILIAVLISAVAFFIRRE